MSEHTDSNGNGNGGKFGIVAKEDPILAKMAPSARRRAMLDNVMPFGARMFFCYLIDCSLWTGVNSSTGVVRFENSTLAGRFDVDEKTIQNWKNWLRAGGYIWTTEKFMKNCYPITVYHIVALVGERPPKLNLETEDGSLVEDDISSNRRRFKNSYRDPDTGKFARRGSKTAETPNRAFSSENADSQAPAEKILPVSTETNCRAERQPDAAGNGTSVPPRTANGCRGERQMVAGEDGNSVPPTAENGCRDARKKTAGNKESPNRVKSIETRGTPPQDLDEAFNKWRKTKLPKLYPDELKALKLELLQRKKLLEPGELAHTDLDRRIEAIDVELYGGALPKKQKSSAAARTAAVPGTPGPALSQEQIAAHGKRLGALMREAVR